MNVGSLATPNMSTKIMYLPSALHGVTEGVEDVSVLEINQKSIWVFTQMTRRQNFDARLGTDWTVSFFSALSIGRHVKFDACGSKSLTPPSLCEKPKCVVNVYSLLTCCMHTDVGA